MANILKRYNSIRRADAVDDHQISASISGALIASETQEQLQMFFLSRLRQLIFGEQATEHWFDDMFSEGILSLRELSASSDAAVVRTGVSLVGVTDGANRVFVTPDHFIHDLNGTGKTIELWHNGRRLAQTSTSNPELGDYTVAESGGLGTGYNMITLITFAPVDSSGLLANYQKAL